MKYNSYYLYRKYEKRDSQDALPSIPSVYSIDGNGTMPKVIHTSQDPECGDIPWQYRWVNMDINKNYICDECYSYPDRTISGCPYCIGNNRYRDVFNQVSYDSGETWESVSTATTLYEENSENCGYVSPYKNQYFTMHFITSQQLHFHSSASGDIYYSLDSGSTWIQSDYPPVVKAGQRIMWKGNKIPLTSGITGIGRFVMGVDDKESTYEGDAEIELEGNIMSLLYGDDFADKTDLSDFSCAFVGLFEDLVWVVNAENLILPATTLASYCYWAMFAGCNNLKKTPKKLPATTLSDWCYANMFMGCSKITKAPSLYATTLVPHCYDSMFFACKSLNSIECYAEVTPETAINYCYLWVDSVNEGRTEKGVFYKKPGVVWPRGDNGIPNGWDEQSCE